MTSVSVSSPRERKSKILLEKNIFTYLFIYLLLKPIILEGNRRKPASQNSLGTPTPK